MTQIEDVLRAIPHVVSAIEERKKWGIPYRDCSLESKRRSAILWLRSDKSKRGWVRDRVINCKSIPNEGTRFWNDVDAAMNAEDPK